MRVVASGPKRSSSSLSAKLPREPIDAAGAGDARLLEVEHEARDELVLADLDRLAVELDERPLRVGQRDRPFVMSRL